jgi:hypothetical protein
MTLRLLTLKIEEGQNIDSLLERALATLERWKSMFTHQDSIGKIIAAFNALKDNAVDGPTLASDFQRYTGSTPEPVKTVGYLIASLFSVSQQSFYLQAALIKSLDEILNKGSRGAYKFILLPFLEAFWFTRISNMPGDITEANFRTNTSVPYYNSSPEDKKVKTMFRILGNHLRGINVDSRLESWIDG